MLTARPPVQIAASTLKLSGQSESYRSHELRQHLEMWVGERPQARQTEGDREGTRRIQRPPEAADGGLYGLLAKAAKAKDTAKEPAESGSELDAETERILLLLEKLFGVKGARSLVARFKAVQADLGQAQGRVQAPAQAAQGQQPAGWGMIYEESERTVSYQSASLVAEGTLKLADGTALAFKLDWTQTSLSIRESSTRIAMGDAQLKDPLILDLDGNGIAFAGTMAVALDGAKPSTVARPAGADAMLVRDADGDGAVDAGEVLGSRSGQAFADLAALDGDGNGWIDAGDAVWTQLRLLDGSGRLSALDGRVGALATTSVLLPYEHRDANDSLQAAGRRGGVALTADGTAVAVAQVDLVA